MEYVSWFICAIALFGAYLNAKQDVRGFLLWMVSNTYLCLLNLSIGQYSQAALFFAYLCITIQGFYTWRKNQKAQEKAAKVPVTE
jgi:nicotinamide riboside transporter PnuC